MDSSGNPSIYARIVYLLAELRVKLPPVIAKVLPGGEWLSQLYLGAGATEIPIDKITPLYQAGMALGRGTTDELQLLLVRAIQEHVDYETTRPKDMLQLFAALGNLKGGDSILIGESQLNLGDWSYDPKMLPTYKWASHFEPADDVITGFYQGLFVIMGRPGTGKTSLMLSMMESLRAMHIADSLLFVENELPMPMMQYKMRPMIDRGVRFKQEDMLVCASWGHEQILQYCIDNPDPGRVVFWDCPDVVTGSGEQRRFDLEKAYQTMIRVKQISKAVFVSSQPNRKGQASDDMNAVAEAWQKAWYADAIIGVNNVGTNEDGTARLRMKSLKDRFGVAGRVSVVRYDYATLQAMGSEPMLGDEDY